MKLNIQSSSFNILIIGVLGLASCRSADQDSLISGKGGLTAVKVNLLGTEYANPGGSSSVASLKKIAGITNVDTQRQIVMQSPSSYITVESTPVYTSLTPIASTKSLNPVASTDGGNLGKDKMFRVIIYKSNGDYIAHYDYVIGQKVTREIELSGGEKYTVVAYSYGNVSLPDLNESEKKISTAKVDYDPKNRDFVYQKIENFTPNNKQNTLDIKLRHKQAHFTIVLFGSKSNIISVNNAKIGNDYPSASFSLDTGKVDVWNASSELPVNFPVLNSEIVTSDPVFINNDTNNGNFSAEVITEKGEKNEINLVHKFKIEPEHKTHLKVNFGKVVCGAFLGPNNTNWREMMCHNIGAYLSNDPFSPDPKIHGGKFQWGVDSIGGYKGRYISQEDDQKDSNNNEVDGGWEDSFGSFSANPCPDGYKLPSKDQWQAILDNNTLERKGIWEDNGNFDSVLYITDNRSKVHTLMLPLAGYRDNDKAGKLHMRGAGGYYWSSTQDNPNNLQKYEGLEITKDKVELAESGFGYGYSVRCIKE